MTPTQGTTVRCTQCGTTFSTADAAAVQAHAGHPLEHIQQG